jgi:hypothetical protein
MLLTVVDFPVQTEVFKLAEMPFGVAKSTGQGPQPAATREAVTNEEWYERVLRTVVQSIERAGPTDWTIERLENELGKSTIDAMYEFGNFGMKSATGGGVERLTFAQMTVPSDGDRWSFEHIKRARCPRCCPFSTAGLRSTAAHHGCQYLGYEPQAQPNMMEVGHAIKVVGGRRAETADAPERDRIRFQQLRSKARNMPEDNILGVGTEFDVGPWSTEQIRCLAFSIREDAAG